MPSRYSNSGACGGTRRTLHRYLRDEVFIAEFRKRIEDELGSARSKVAVALVRGASMPGPGQAAMQKIYWQRLGELVDRYEHSGPLGREVAIKLLLEEVDCAQTSRHAGARLELRSGRDYQW